MTKGFLTLECECDGLSVSASTWSEYDSVVLGDSSYFTYPSPSFHRPFSRLAGHILCPCVLVVGLHINLKNSKKKKNSMLTCFSRKHVAIALQEVQQDHMYSAN